MSANGDAARRDMWAGRIERCLASGMAIGEWRSLNKVSKSSLYRRLAVTKAIVPAVSAAGQAVADSAEETPGSKDWRSGKPLGAFLTKRETPRGLSLYAVALTLADVSVVVAFVVAWAFVSPVASTVAGHMLVTSVSERAIESIADAGCFMA